MLSGRLEAAWVHHYIVTAGIQSFEFSVEICVCVCVCDGRPTPPGVFN